MNVRLVTTWNQPCGIAEHSAMLKEAVEAADPAIEITPDSAALDPQDFFASYDWATDKPDILHLNYHAALHSRWTPTQVARVQAKGLKVIVTYHDTIGEISPAELRASGDHRLDRLEQLAQIVDALVVHEPCEGLLGGEYYWRMGVPAPLSPLQRLPLAWRDQPMLGSIGFPFPWKNYDQLATITREIGWALLLIAPGATAAQADEWRRLNPDATIYPAFLPRAHALSLLSACDATAFPYTCANTAQSAAILQGIAARKPVIATAHCRQFRALFNDPLGRTAITWVEALDEIAFTLSHLIRIERCSPAIVALAKQDAWAKLGQQYAELYRKLASRAVARAALAPQESRK